MEQGKYPYRSLSKDNIFAPHLKRIDKNIAWLSITTGISANNLSLWGTGKVEPLLCNAMDVAKALGVTVEDIWGRSRIQEDV